MAITGIAHINLLVPPGTLDDAAAFYGDTLGLHRVPVPRLQQGTLAWFNISPQDGGGGQQVHIALGFNEPDSSRHPCFRVASLEDLLALQHRIYEHYLRGGPAAPVMADKPGGPGSG